MEPWVLGVSLLPLVLVLLFMGVHIAVTLGMVGLLGFTLLAGLPGAMGLLTTTPLATTASFALTVMPLFVLMGHFAFHGGIGEDVYTAAHTWLRRVPGGLAIATTMAGAAFAAASGSSLGAAATFTKIALPEMLKHRYDRRLACGAIASAGTLAIMIPPSGMMVIYSIFTNVSLGKLLIAGIVPGLLSTMVYVAVAFLRVRLNPSLAPTVAEPAPWREKVAAIRWLAPLSIVVFTVLGGIYFGVFTPTEAAAIGAVTALLISLMRRSLGRRAAMSALRDTADTTAMVFAIIIGAMLFGRFLAVSGVTNKVVEFMTGLGSPALVLIIILIAYMIMGMFLENVAIAALSLPVFFPVIVKMGMDPIWFGIIVVKVCEIALLTPPVGMNCFVVKATAGDTVTLEDVFRGVMPFLAGDMAVLIILLLFPAISLWLPGMMVT